MCVRILPLHYSRRAATPAAAMMPRGAAVCCTARPSVEEGASLPAELPPLSLTGTVVATVLVETWPSEPVVVTATSLLVTATVELTTVDRVSD